MPALPCLSISGTAAGSCPCLRSPLGQPPVTAPPGELRAPAPSMRTSCHQWFDGCRYGPHCGLWQPTGFRRWGSVMRWEKNRKVAKQAACSLDQFLLIMIPICCNRMIPNWERKQIKQHMFPSLSPIALAGVPLAGVPLPPNAGVRQHYSFTQSTSRCSTAFKCWCQAAPPQSAASFSTAASHPAMGARWLQCCTRQRRMPLQLCSFRHQPQQRHCHVSEV